jgi:hypothetical protein
MWPAKPKSQSVPPRYSLPGPWETWSDRRYFNQKMRRGTLPVSRFIWDVMGALSYYCLFLGGTWEARMQRRMLCRWVDPDDIAINVRLTVEIGTGLEGLGNEPGQCIWWSHWQGKSQFPISVLEYDVCCFIKYDFMWISVGKIKPQVFSHRNFI